jgi:hypothetical protein
MNMKLNFLLWVLILTMPELKVSAQDFSQDHKKVQMAYLNLNDFYCEIKIDMYTKTNASKPDRVLKSVLKKQANNSWHTIGKTTVLVNDKCMLYLDENQKTILYTKLDALDKKKSSNPYINGVIDSLPKKNDSVVFNGISDGKIKYTLYTSKQTIVRTEISIDQQTYLIAKIVYYYKTGKQMEFEKIEIGYENRNMNPIFSKDEFSEKKYVNYTGKTLKPALAFAEYRTEIIEQEPLAK